MSSPLAHILGVPVEETLGEFAPALVVLLAALRASLRRARPRRGERERASPRAALSRAGTPRRGR